MDRSRFPMPILFLGVMTFLAGCQGAPSTFLPESPSGIVMSDLMTQAFIIAGVVFVLVETLLLVAVLKHRHSGENIHSRDDLPPQTEGNNILETAWTVAPAIVLAIVFYLSVIAYQSVENVPFLAESKLSQPQTVNVRVVGHQFWWYFEYPDLKIKTANEYHVPVNIVTTLSIESADVIHSYWVPQLGRKVDGIPGHINHTWFKPLETGTFTGECAELCGEQHANMRFEVVVDTPEDFQKWVTQQQALPATMSGAAADGENVFLQGACISCHTIAGTNAKGLAGPDLTHVGSRKTIAAGQMENKPENMAKWLADPQAQKPGNKMPNLGLNQDQITKLVAFLESLK